MLHEWLALAVEAVWVSWLCVDDLSVDVHRIIILKWWVASQHFIEQDADGPPVHCFAVTLVEQNLWSNILRRAANSVGPLCDYFGKPKVNHLKISITANHDVLRLQISVHNIFALQVLKYRHYLCPIKRCLFRVKVADTSMIRKKVSSF